MAYELLVLDVDGTLVNTKKEITVQFVLPANTAGNVEHYVKLQMA